MAAVFDMYSAYYDLLYRDKDYPAEAEHIHQLIQRYRPGAQSILELGSGTGRHARLLAEKGYRVHGIERSPTMLAQARRHAAESACADRLTFEQRDIRAPGAAGRYDVVISLFHVISYLTETPDIQTVFAAVSRHLQGRGIFIFDCWYAPAVLSQGPEVRVKRMEDEQYRLVRVAEPVRLPRENKVIVNYDMFIERKADHHIQHFTEEHPMRYFSEPELAPLLAAAGQEIVACEADLGLGTPPSAEHWGLTVVAQPRTDSK